jgi:hypothetical protein
MADEKNENRVRIEDLPQPEHGLTNEEAQQVKGGAEIRADEDTTESAGKIKFNEFTIKKLTDKA